jgi:hypothetical protein
VPINGAGSLRHNRIISTGKYTIVRERHSDCDTNRICPNRVGERQAGGICPEADSAAVASCRESDPPPGAAKSRAATSHDRAAAGRHNGRLLPDQQCGNLLRARRILPELRSRRDRPCR